MTKGKDKRVWCTYSDLDENAHLWILLILLLSLVPFKRTILSWFVPSQQRSALYKQSNRQGVYTFYDGVSWQLLNKTSFVFEIHVKM